MSETQTPEKVISLEGRLEDFPLADILQILQVSGKSGALFLTRPGMATGVVVFRNGQIVQALASDFYQTLGDRLVSKGAVTLVDVHEGLAYRARYPGMRLGDALVELGATTREVVESEVKDQMAEVIDRLMQWSDAQFEFRVGVVSLWRGLPDFTVDLILDEGVEPRHILLEASLLQDKRKRELERMRKVLARDGTVAPGAPEAAVERRERAETGSGSCGDEGDPQKAVQWFDPLSSTSTGLPGTERLNAALSFLTLSEELFSAQGRGEMGLLLLRYASELYADGGLVLRDADSFRLLGQFGSGFGIGEHPGSSAKTYFAPGESPLFDLIARDGMAYAGLVVASPLGGLKDTSVAGAGAVPALAVPLIVLGSVALILVCRTPATGAPDARALLALARQVSVALENMTLRELVKRTSHSVDDGRRGPSELTASIRKRESFGAAYAG